MSYSNNESITFNAHYFDSREQSTIFESPSDHLYYFKTFVGKHLIEIEFGDSLFLIDIENETVELHKGPKKVLSNNCATLIRGYMPPEQTVSLKGSTVLPYVNGCSTKQIVFPMRPGDPTFQYLYIPPYSSEQQHHIHSTTRVAFILDGEGESVVGIENCCTREKLFPGKVVILEPMCPHHFETKKGKALKVLPLHVYSTASSLENSHPMKSGTFIVGAE